MKRALEFFLAAAALALGSWGLRSLLRRAPAGEPFVGSPADQAGRDEASPSDKASPPREPGGPAVMSLPMLQVSAAPKTFRRKTAAPPPAAAP